MWALVILEQIKADCGAQRSHVKGWGPSSVLRFAIQGEKPGQGWMHPAYSHLSVHVVLWQHFGLYGALFKRWGLLGTDGIDLAAWGKSVFPSGRAGRKWQSAQSQRCDVVGLAETWWDGSHNCSAVVHGLRFLDKDAIAVSSKDCIQCTEFSCCLGDRLVKS